MAFSKSRVDRAGTLLAATLATDGRAPWGEEHLFEALEVVDWWRAEHSRPLSRVASNLRHYAAKEGKPVVAQRLKKTSTVADKLTREPKMKLSRMADVGGVRAVLPTQEAAYRVAAQLQRNWTIARVRDYVAEPKVDGYRALHLINRNRGRLIEIQLRTPRQDAWANAVEIYSRGFFPGLKFGGGPQPLKDFLLLIAEAWANEDRGLPRDPSYPARYRELADRVTTLLGETEMFHEP